MSRLDDALRATMRAGDADAPTAAQFRFRRPVTPAHNRFRWVPAAAAAACVAIVVGIVVAVVPGHSGRHATTTPSTAVLDCPTTPPAASSPRDLYPVPPPRSDALTVSDRLVPTTAPARAVVCAYLHQDAGRLTGSRVVDSGLGTIPDTLAWLPPQGAAPQACTADLRPTDGDAYLIGLSYPSGTLWVAAPGNHCLGSSNGRFTTRAHVATDAIAAYRSGGWTPPAKIAEDGCRVTTGRLGQERALVPGAPDSVLVCQGLGTGGVPPNAVGRSRVGTTADRLALVATLSALPTEPNQSLSLAHCIEPAQLRYYFVTFSYRVGPPVTVSLVPGCTPAIHNGSLQASDASTVLPIVQRVLAR